MKYKYVAISTEGILEKGNIEAESLKEALEKIRKQDLIPIEIKKEDTLLNRLKLKINKDKTGDILFFTENLYRLTVAGIPIDRSMKILSKIFLNNNYKMAQITNKISLEIKQGKPLSEALKNTKIFPVFYINLIKAGENSGHLTEVLKYLTDYIKKQKKFKQELLSSILYPLFLMIFGMLAIQTVFVYVLPKFGKIFEEMGVSPPTLTKLLINCGIFWKNWGWIFLIFLLIIVCYFHYLLTNVKKRKWFEKQLIRLPIIGKFIICIELAKIFNTLAITNKGGVNIEKSLELVSEISHLEIIKDFFKHISKEIIAGKKLSVLMQQLPGNFYFISELISIGEETGELGENFKEIALILEEESQNLAKKILILIEPITILSLGLILGISIISILLAIFDLRF